MSRTEIKSPNSFTHDAGTERTRAVRLDPPPRRRVRLDVSEAEKRLPLIVRNLFCPQMYDLELPPLHRSHFVPRRETQATIRPEGCRGLEAPRFNGIPGPAPAVDAKPTRAHNELEGSFSVTESAPTPRRGCGDRLWGMFVAVWSFWRREREISRSIAALSEMDDRALRDIGIHHRLQIPEIVRHGGQRL